MSKSVAARARDFDNLRSSVEEDEDDIRKAFYASEALRRSVIAEGDLGEAHFAKQNEGG